MDNGKSTKDKVLEETILMMFRELISKWNNFSEQEKEKFSKELFQNEYAMDEVAECYANIKKANITDDAKNMLLKFLQELITINQKNMKSKS